MSVCRTILAIVLVCLVAGAVQAQEKPVVGLIPKAQKPIKLDGKLDKWQGAFVTPVHVGHPDFANRGGEFLYLYIGLLCLDQKPAHRGAVMLSSSTWTPGEARSSALRRSILEPCICSPRRSPSGPFSR
jgi:hypothetical protein